MNKDSKYNFCISCGYIDNGNIISKKQSEIKDIEIYLGKDYDKINRNEAYLLNFILGPLYFCYKKYFLLGIILVPIDLFLYYLLSTLITTLIPIPYIVTIIFSFFFIRIIYMSISNMIYLKLCHRKIKKIKKNNKDNYIAIIRNKDYHSSYLSYIIDFNNYYNFTNSKMN